MSNQKPYSRHLNNSNDLVTTYEATRQGFLAMVLEKSKLADPFIDEARTLKIKASTAATPSDLLAIPDIRSGLLTASGASIKATVYLQEQDITGIIREFIKNFLEVAGDHFVEELVYRFLLTKGETLGGRIRNLVGAWAQRQLVGFILPNFTLAGKSYSWFNGKSWQQCSPDDVRPNLDSLNGLNWLVNGKERTLLFNRKCPLIQNEAELGNRNRAKNVDLLLLDCSISDVATSQRRNNILTMPQRYLALGELKGGFDPAGADEHWKTGGTSLERIRTSFTRHQCYPEIMFIARAIEKSMADEIWALLESGRLTNAANLSDAGQMVAITTWLCNL